MRELSCLLLTLGVATAGAVQAQDKPLTIGTLSWAENIAVANMWKLILEDEADYRVKLSNVGKSPLFSGVANGDFDVSLETWLPNTDAAFLEPYDERIAVHDAWYDGAGMGLVVPSYVEIDTIAELVEHAGDFKYQGQPTIVGIDPGSSISGLTDEAIEAYGLDMQQISSSEAAMMAALDDAYKRQEPIVVTLWSPHWAFAEYDLKYLEDPKNLYGDNEAIYWFSRQGFGEDDPWLTAVLNAWQMDDDSLGSLMATIEQAGDAAEGAQAWIDEHQALVDDWLAAGDTLKQRAGTAQ
ncbi:glycine betaine ABC transporter substrate-binding protein [Halomonas sp. WWR20]